MTLGTELLIGALFLSGSTILVISVTGFLKARKLERLRHKQLLVDFWQSKAEEIYAARQRFRSFLRSENGYFANYLLTSWKEKYTRLLAEIKDKPRAGLGMDPDLVDAIATIIQYFKDGEDLRSQFNREFIPKEISAFDSLFQDIEGKSLDHQQKIAVVTDEDNNLVIAGAGSGKTTTIVGKVKYLQQKHTLHPQDFLLISFTNKSAASLAARIGDDGFETLTFHKFGLRVIAECQGVKPSIFDENLFQELLQRHFDQLTTDKNYLDTLTQYFLNYLKPPKSQFDFDNQGEYIQYLKDQNFRTYKPVQVNFKGKVTILREVVKSIEECRLANFLLFNSVDYEYEARYQFDTATKEFQQYKPDFSIYANGKRIYLEHFALSVTGDVPPFFTKQGETYQMAKKRYWEKVEWARELHKTNKTILVETYSYQFENGTVFDHLQQQLASHGVVLKPLTIEEQWLKIKQAAKDDVDSILTLCATFITLMKSNNYGFADLEAKNQKITDPFTKKRNRAFFSIVRPLYERYAADLIVREEIDFSDMINKATEFISSRAYKKRYKYIIVDEFQDISIGRYKLLQAIKSVDPSTRLFCVGDDWQSIYRFTGSDIALFKNFQDYFGITVRSTIETTYRYAGPLLTMSNEFITKNPNQSQKLLRPANNTSMTKYFLKYATSEDEDDTEALLETFTHVISDNAVLAGKSVYILGRYSFDIGRIKNQEKIFSIDREKGTLEYTYRRPDGTKGRIDATFMTVHKAKGLEADIVIILNCNSGKHGFPAGLSDDQVLNLLLSEADRFENGEERRLFYVAMTRAKEAVYFIADTYRKSKFVLELEVDQHLNTHLKCPECKTADLILRKSGVASNGTTYKFYGCTNYFFGCTYTNTVFSN
jgi:DNA helicase-4